MNFLQRIKIYLFYFLLFTFNIISLQAQEPSFVALDTDMEYTVIAGKEQQLALSFIVKEGFHIQANQVKDENLIPTVLYLDAPDQLFIGEPIYPPAAEFQLRGAEEALLVFGDELLIKIPIQINESDKNTYTVNGKLYYQACDDRKCFFPRDLPFSITIYVKADSP